MNVNDVNAVLDTIADKLCIVTDNFTEMLPKIVHYKIVANAAGVIVLAFLVLLCIAAAVWGHKQVKKDPISIYPDVICTAAITIGLFTLAVMLLLAVNLIGWVMFPDIKAMDYILGLT